MSHLEDLYRRLIESSGADVNKPGLAKTPKRALDAFKFFVSGYEQGIQELVNNAIFEAESSNMVVVKDIEFYSLCEHHLLPFFGSANVGYIPNGKIIGLSKIPKLVDMFSRRLQVQECLGRDIALALADLLHPKGVIVTMHARHTCMSMRGVQKQNAAMKTVYTLGQFETDQSAKSDFFTLCQS